MHMASIDPYEGVLPDGNYLYRHWQSPEDVPKDVLDYLHELEDWQGGKTIEERLNSFKSKSEMLVQHSYRGRHNYYINCWHINDFESAAMWQVYSQKGFGIAIVSDVDRMREALEGEIKELYLGSVRYIDHKVDAVDMKNTFQVFLAKSHAYSYEREARLMCRPIDKWKEQTSLECDPAHGMYAQCDLEKLIEEIIVSPYEPTWVFDEVLALVQNYGLNLRVKHSDMLTPPVR